MQVFPKNTRAQQGLANLIKLKNNANQSPSQDTINQLMIHNQGQLRSVVQKTSDLIKEYPETFIIWNIWELHLKAWAKLLKPQRPLKSN